LIKWTFYEFPKFFFRKDQNMALRIDSTPQLKNITDKFIYADASGVFIGKTV
jgi:hypothetical protein